MRRLLVALSVTAAVSCQSVTASETAEVTVALTPQTVDAACMRASPDPVAVRVGQGLNFVNKSSSAVTVVLVEDNTPLVSAAPSRQSGAVKFSMPGTWQYYIQGCGASVSEQHTITVTVN